jgi:hypothetical protein
LKNLQKKILLLNFVNKQRIKVSERYEEVRPMAMASLSPSSVLASPIQVNPQVKTDLQTSVPQLAQDAQKTAKVERTDTITISAQALKMADKNAVAKETAGKADEQRALQLAGGRANAARTDTQRNAVKTYAAVSANP